MKRRVSRVTRVTKPVDERLARLEQKLQQIEKSVTYLEQTLPKLVRKSEKTENPSYTYTIVRDQ